MSVSTESCFDCGRDFFDGTGESLRACLWDLPAAGGQHWAWVQVCPQCAARRRQRRAALLVGVALFVSALTAVAAVRFLP